MGGDAASLAPNIGGIPGHGGDDLVRPFQTVHWAFSEWQRVREVGVERVSFYLCGIS